MFEKYSSEYAGIITLLVTPLLGNYLSDTCAGELGGIIGTTVISVVVAGIMLLKRYSKGDVTVSGFRKD
jgi:hypothetical protein